MMLAKEKEIFKKKILEGIEKFNEIRVPEARAELLEFKEKKFVVKFSGHMCYTCGVYDYFEDLLWELKDLGMKTKIKKNQRFNNYFLVEYQIL